jgi:prevent-host-death family protein
MTARSVTTPRQSRSLQGANQAVSASQAKTHLLEILDRVDRTRTGLVITKRGRPVARLMPMELEKPASIFGCMKGTFKIAGDIVGPEPDAWEAMS